MNIADHGRWVLGARNGAETLLARQGFRPFVTPDVSGLDDRRT